MKNAKTYEKKIKQLLGSPRKKRLGPVGDIDQTLPTILIEAILEEDSTTRKAKRALAVLTKEFVDFNELRVSPTKEILDCIGAKYPQGNRKAHMIREVLGGIYRHTSTTSLKYITDRPKRERRRCLLELGLSPYAAALVMLKVLDAHAVPVDQTLVDCLEMSEYIHPGSNLNTVRSFLERIVGPNDGLAAHAALRRYVERSAKALTKWQKARDAQAEKAQAAQAEKAAAQAKAEAAKAKKVAKKSLTKAAKKPTKTRNPAGTIKKAKKKISRKTAKAAKRASRNRPQRGRKKAARNKK
jgi:endonuclease III